MAKSWVQLQSKNYWFSAFVNHCLFLPCPVPATISFLSFLGCKDYVGFRFSNITSICKSSYEWMVFNKIVFVLKWVFMCHWRKNSNVWLFTNAIVPEVRIPHTIWDAAKKNSPDRQCFTSPATTLCAFHFCQQYVQLGFIRLIILLHLHYS